MLALTGVTVAMAAMAQTGGVYRYEAHLVRTDTVISPKPLLADVVEWLPEAEVWLEREADILHIDMPGVLLFSEVQAHVEAHGYLLGGLVLEGAAERCTPRSDARLPWLEGTDTGTVLTQEEVALLKEAWVAAHPREYDEMLRPGSTLMESR